MGDVKRGARLVISISVPFMFPGFLWYYNRRAEGELKVVFFFFSLSFKGVVGRTQHTHLIDIVFYHHMSWWCEDISPSFISFHFQAFYAADVIWHGWTSLRDTICQRLLHLKMFHSTSHLNISEKSMFGVRIAVLCHDILSIPSFHFGMLIKHSGSLQRGFNTITVPLINLENG